MEHVSTISAADFFREAIWWESSDHPHASKTAYENERLRKEFKNQHSRVRWRATIFDVSRFGSISCGVLLKKDWLGRPSYAPWMEVRVRFDQEACLEKLSRGTECYVVGRPRVHHDMEHGQDGIEFAWRLYVDDADIEVCR